MKSANSLRWLQTGLGVVALVAVPIGGTFVTEQLAPFDRRFESCDENVAEWKLVVNCRIQGSSEREEYVDYFCKRRDPDATWRLPFGNDTTRAVGWQSIPGDSRYTSMFGSQFSYRFSATDTAQGAEIGIGVDQNQDGVKPTTHVAKFTVPFRRTVSGRQGSLEYSAAWHRVK